MTTQTESNSTERDEAAETELDLWADNTERLYRQHHDIIGNLKRKIARGVYNPELAPKLWRYWYDEASRDYKRELGYGFSVAVRQACAEERARDEYQRIMNGEYNHIEPIIDADTRQGLRVAMSEWDRLVAEGIANGMTKDEADARARCTMNAALDRITG